MVLSSKLTQTWIWPWLDACCWCKSLCFSVRVFPYLATKEGIDSSNESRGIIWLLPCISRLLCCNALLQGICARWGPETTKRIFSKVIVWRRVRHQHTHALTTCGCLTLNKESWRSLKKGRSVGVECTLTGWHVCHTYWTQVCTGNRASLGWLASTPHLLNNSVCQRSLRQFHNNMFTQYTMGNFFPKFCMKGQTWQGDPNGYHQVLAHPT